MVNKAEKLKTTYKVYVPREGYRTFKVSKRFAKMIETFVDKHEDTLRALAKL